MIQKHSLSKRSQMQFIFTPPHTVIPMAGILSLFIYIYRLAGEQLFLCSDIII